MGKHRWFPRWVRCEATSNLWGQEADQAASLRGFGPAHKHLGHPSEGGAVSFVVSFVVICLHKMNCVSFLHDMWCDLFDVCFFFLNHWSLPHKIKSGPKNFCLEWPGFIVFFVFLSQKWPADVTASLGVSRWYKRSGALSANERCGFCHWLRLRPMRFG